MKIPITFEWRGKWYVGEISPVSGSGRDYGSSWHLMINNYYFGELIISQLYGWRFLSPTGYFEDMADYFGDYLTAYIG